MTKPNPAVAVAKKSTEKQDVRTLSSGVKVRAVTVSASLIMDVQNQIKYPPVPIVKDDEKGQTYENPDHPSYKRACAEVDSQRAIAAMDAIIMFGVELVDGLPKDDRWLRKLKTMQKAGSIDLSGFDLKDEIDLEFLYKKYEAVRSEDYDIINEMVGVTAEGIADAEDSFQGNA